MNIISQNEGNLLISFSKQEVEDLHVVLDAALTFDYEGGEDEHRTGKTVNKLYDSFDEYLESNKPPELTN